MYAFYMHQEVTGHLRVMEQWLDGEYGSGGDKLLLTEQ
jgi:hypothetical protein